MFTSNECRVFNPISGKLVLQEKRHNNIVKEDIMSPKENSLQCVSAMTNIAHI